MLLSFTVKLTQVKSLVAVRKSTISETVPIKQNLETKSTVDRKLSYTVCLEID